MVIRKQPNKQKNNLYIFINLQLQYIPTVSILDKAPLLNKRPFLGAYSNFELITFSIKEEESLRG